MFDKVLHFIKYNNATIFIILFVFILGSGVMAAESGVLGEREVRTEGIDNTLLLSVNLETLDMDYKIGNIQEDDDNYYVVYTFIDLAYKDNAWQYIMQQKTRKVSKKFKGDLGLYLAEELSEEYEQKIKYLKKEQSKALNKGKERRMEVVEYSGLLGKALNMTTKVFPSYQVVKKREIASPKILPSIIETSSENLGTADNLVDVYNDYVETHIEEIVELNILVATSTEPVASSTEDVIIEEGVVETATSTIDVLETTIPEETESDVVVIDLSQDNATSTSE